MSLKPYRKYERSRKNGWINTMKSGRMMRSSRRRKTLIQTALKGGWLHFEFAMRSVDEVGRMIGGWSKQQEGA